ncbi:MAG: histidinol-phosphate aminotransferase family protein [Bacteroidales bacterium]|nr:histidinol-phosphate aminotransferase family protein [Bacteroidales bacterium]
MKTTINNIFSESLQEQGFRVSDAATNEKIFLNRNELPFDLPEELKKKIVHKIQHRPWNMYPKVDDVELKTLLGNYAGVPHTCINVGAGAAMLATTLLNYFGLCEKKLVIARPTFSLYEYHCKSYNIPYTSWLLDEDLCYTFETLPNLTEKHVVFIASPNNPTGNVLNTKVLELILKNNKQTYFVVDEVYYEFAETEYIRLIKKHKNLVLLRSFSKTFASAAVRFGYMITNEELTEHFAKLILPFSVNIIAENTAKVLLENKEWLSYNRELISHIIANRELLYLYLKSLDGDEDFYRVYPSQGNFIFISFKSSELHASLQSYLSRHKIAVLNTSNQPGIPNSMRISIGSQSDTNKLIKIFEDFLKLKC